MNAQQQADWLRKADDNRSGRALARRAGKAAGGELDYNVDFQYERVQCTSCSKQLNCLDVDAIGTHPLLKVLYCQDNTDVKSNSGNRSLKSSAYEGWARDAPDNPIRPDIRRRIGLSSDIRSGRISKVWGITRQQFECFNWRRIEENEVAKLPDRWIAKFVTMTGRLNEWASLGQDCVEFYGKGEFERDEDGSDEYCRWCANGGELLCCSFCTSSFCKSCIRRNLGRSYLKSADDADSWKCLVCDNGPIKGLQKKAAAVKDYARKNSVSRTAKKEKQRKEREDLKKNTPAKRKGNNKAERSSSNSSSRRSIQSKIKVRLSSKRTTAGNDPQEDVTSSAEHSSATDTRHFVDEAFHDLKELDGQLRSCLENMLEKSWKKSKRTSLSEEKVITIVRRIRTMILVTKYNLDKIETDLRSEVERHFGREALKKIVYGKEDMVDPLVTELGIQGEIGKTSVMSVEKTLPLEENKKEKEGKDDQEEEGKGSQEEEEKDGQKEEEKEDQEKEGKDRQEEDEKDGQQEDEKDDQQEDEKDCQREDEKDGQQEDEKDDQQEDEKDCQQEDEKDGQQEDEKDCQQEDEKEDQEEEEKDGQEKEEKGVREEEKRDDDEEEKDYLVEKKDHGKEEKHRREVEGKHHCEEGKDHSKEEHKEDHVEEDNSSLFLTQSLDVPSTDENDEGKGKDGMEKENEGEGKKRMDDKGKVETDGRKEGSGEEGEEEDDGRERKNTKETRDHDRGKDVVNNDPTVEDFIEADEVIEDVVEFLGNDLLEEPFPEHGSSPEILEPAERNQSSKTQEKVKSKAEKSDTKEGRKRKLSHTSDEAGNVLKKFKDGTEAKDDKAAKHSAPGSSPKEVDERLKLLDALCNDEIESSSNSECEGKKSKTTLRVKFPDEKIWGHTSVMVQKLKVDSDDDSEVQKLISTKNVRLRRKKAAMVSSSDESSQNSESSLEGLPRKRTKQSVDEQMSHSKKDVEKGKPGKKKLGGPLSKRKKSGEEVVVPQEAVSLSESELVSLDDTSVDMIGLEDITTEAALEQPDLTSQVSKDKKMNLLLALEDTSSDSDGPETVPTEKKEKESQKSGKKQNDELKTTHDSDAAKDQAASEKKTPATPLDKQQRSARKLLRMRISESSSSEESSSDRRKKQKKQSIREAREREIQKQRKRAPSSSSESESEEESGSGSANGKSESDFSDFIDDTEKQKIKQRMQRKKRGFLSSCSEDDSQKAKKKDTKLKDESSSDSLPAVTAKDKSGSGSDSSIEMILRRRKPPTEKKQGDIRNFLKKEDRATPKTPEKKKREVKKSPSSSDDDEDDSDIEVIDKNTPSSKGGRKNIKKITRDKDLKESTKEALKSEADRRKRVEEKRRKLLEIYPELLESQASQEVVSEVALDVEESSGKRRVCVDEILTANLKKHQVEGIRFMYDCLIENVEQAKKNPGGGCILAHCMGLGKTLQVVTFLHTVLTSDEFPQLRTCLVLAPYNTILNWVAEFQKWLDDKGITNLDVFDLSTENSNVVRASRLRHWKRNGGVMIMSYNKFRLMVQYANRKNTKKDVRDSFLKHLLNPGADILVCDEGHYLKNVKSQLCQSLKDVRTRRRIVLTGTPMQNNLKEYFCMVDFVKPNLLGTLPEFTNRFVNPIQNGQYVDSVERDVRLMRKRAHILHELLDGSVQTRDHSILLKVLPPKHEYVISIQLSEVVQKLYRRYLDWAKAKMNEPGGRRSLFRDFQTFAAICAHPRILQMKTDMKNEKERIDNFVVYTDDSTTSDDSSSGGHGAKAKKKTQKNGGNDSDIEEVPSEVVWDDILDEASFTDWSLSGKIVLMMEILQECEKRGEKCQSLFVLDLIEEVLADAAGPDGIKKILGDSYADVPPTMRYNSWRNGRDYLRIDGNIPVTERKKFTRMFNSSMNPRCRLILLSTKAAGIGINLIGGNRVIVFDASWNPSHDTQSVFRVFRYGQERPTFIYRFVARGSMEEKVYDRQVTKLSMASRVLDEKQIERHFQEKDVQAFYEFQPELARKVQTPVVPKDTLLADLLLRQKDLIVSYHEHESLLVNREEEKLTEEERKAAWEEYNLEKEGRQQTQAPVSLSMEQLMKSGKSQEEIRNDIYVRHLLEMVAQYPQFHLGEQARFTIHNVKKMYPKLFSGVEYVEKNPADVSRSLVNAQRITNTDAYIQPSHSDADPKAKSVGEYRWRNELGRKQVSQ
ncbi:unnamed protein product [Cyprideis torosa]|uniref:ATP-dependent helicase ATRX n=1 Tax=Cyprideis torosa TaxID=163714 RepID=A0A7R8W109_9CRUS|nr:unnamed protein product [Cyprideis torosa]CAG0880380.1 unnamed protein product [Cyprideis torosa]